MVIFVLKGCIFDRNRFMTGEQLISEVEQITQANLNFVQRKLKHLSDEQLNWKLTKETWSINEVLAHLNSFAAFYHPTFEKKIEKTRFKKPTMNFISSPLGRATWRSMKLGNARNIKRKFRATAAYNPSLTPELVKGNDRDIFIDEQNRFLDLLNESRTINIRKAKVPVNISKIIKFRMGDALLLVGYHNDRHMEQIKRILAHSQFPKK